MPVDLVELSLLNQQWCNCGKRLAPPLELAEPRKRRRNCGVSFTSLPVEIILMIFSYLPTSCLLSRVARVCRYFRRLTLNPIVHHCVRLNEAPIKDMCSFLRRATMARELYITAGEEDFDSIIASISKHQEIRVLKFEGFWENYELFLTMSQSSWWCKLTQFDLCFFVHIDYGETFSDAISTLGLCENLVHLNISCNTGSLPKPILDLLCGPGLRKLKSLTNACLTGFCRSCQITSMAKSAPSSLFSTINM